MRQVRDEWREAQAYPARLERYVAGSNAHECAKERKARHASMECSAIEPARSSESGRSQPQYFQVDTSATGHAEVERKAVC